ncbi:hypothetical protein C4D60_Mb07t22210 [Musa balbisiana]|uniref:60S acidic ribosomal protein P1 n=1 Tax=Musa balbisiana TaxID=52838 RepID=A0A4V4H6V3_MUSBA|nr:hypothetical protein C4D60_Mb07t22210 [Musa balbisiana]
MKTLVLHSYNSLPLSHTAADLCPLLDAPNLRSDRALPLPMAASSIGELACTYAALILHDDGIPITSEKILTVVQAANLTIESYWAPLFAKLLEKRSVDDLILSVGSGGGGAAVAVSAGPAAGAAAPAAAPAVEEKKEEPKEESDDDMGFSLFD